MAAGGNEGRAMSDVGIGKIFELKTAAAEQYGPPEDVASYTGEAIGVYMLMVETADDTDSKVRPGRRKRFRQMSLVSFTRG